jgi:hypothetical protein
LKNLFYSATIIEWLSGDDVKKKILTVVKNIVEESGGKWIIFSYFSVFIVRMRIWPHL